MGDWCKNENNSSVIRTSLESPSGITVPGGFLVCVRDTGVRNPVALLRCSRHGVNGITVRGGLSPSEAPFGRFGLFSPKGNAYHL